MFEGNKVKHMSEKQKPKQKKKVPTKTAEAKKSEQKKLEQLKKKLIHSEQEVQALKDRLLRTAAELDNYKKRTEREISQILQHANEGLIHEILPVIDDLERSLKTMDDADGTVFADGVVMIYQKLLSTLMGRGLEQMESVGQPFDVDSHDALLQIEKEGEPSGIVLEEHEKGYMLNGKVVRHAKVVVSK